MPEPTEQTYYTRENDMEWRSYSQLKDFMHCQAGALAKLNGEYPDGLRNSQAILEGQTMDKLWEGKHAWDMFVLEHRPQLYKKNGEKRQFVIDAEKAYMRAFRDKTFRDFMGDEKNHQTIMTAEIECEGGRMIPFKGKFDAYFPPDEYGDDAKIVDLKYMASIDPVYQDGERKTFIDAYGYDIQAAIYTALCQANTGVRVPYYLAVITKSSGEHENGLYLIHIADWKIDSAMAVVKHWAPIVTDIIDGKREPTRCNKCDVCLATKEVEPVEYDELLKQL